MRALLLLLVLLLIAKNSFSQKQIEIYRNGILGGMYMQQEQLDSAEKYYRQALAIMTDKTKFPAYFTLIKIAHKHNDRKRISEYFTALSCVYPKDSIYSHLKEWAEVKMDKATFDSLYHPKCALLQEKKFTGKYAREIDSIIQAISVYDQAIRNKINKKHDKRTEEEIAALEKEMHDVDSADFVQLYRCIKTYGFPEIDYPQSFSRITLLTHIDNYGHFKKIDSYLLQAIKEGNLSPTQYAYALDRSLTASGMQPKYYWFIPNTPVAEKYKPEQKDLEKVNQDRRQIGLPPYPMWTGWGF